jgi:hypothetical protein
VRAGIYLLALLNFRALNKKLIRMYESAFKYLIEERDHFSVHIFPSNEGKLDENKKRGQIFSTVISVKYIAIDEIAINLGLFEQVYNDHRACRRMHGTGIPDLLPHCSKLLKLTNMYANSFLLSVDKYCKLVDSIGHEIPETNPITEAVLKSLDGLLPNIRHLRNSAAHIEQRIHRKARNKEIEVQDKQNGFLIGVLSGNLLVYTTQSGTNGAIEVSANTLQIIRNNYSELKVLLQEKYAEPQ